ncbi:MAG TPA: class I SAM-dependent methyltransferase [Pirellulales bacterium]|jgi:SAM-dependent methyltransferase
METTASTIELRAPAPHDCDLCGGADFAAVAHSDRRGDPLETVVCTRCGLVSHALIPTEDELTNFYAREYRRAYHGEVAPSARRVMRAWQKGELILRRLSPFMRRSDRVLEIGSGIGCTVRRFQLAGYDAQGIEPNDGFREYGVNTFHARVRPGGLLDIPAEPLYDVVLLVHVIEHLGTPRRAFERIRRMLRPGGRLYVECPNLGAPFALGDKLFHFGHVHNFTPATLRMLARRSGFEVVTQFATPEDPNLRLLLVKMDERDETLDSDSYDQTIAALARYNMVTYHLRRSYLRMRLGMVARAITEALLAPAYVRRVTAQCEQHGSADNWQRTIETPSRRLAA